MLCDTANDPINALYDGSDEWQTAHAAFDRIERSARSRPMDRRAKAFRQHAAEAFS